ncbi:MAG: glycoside hydrolase family 2 protein [Bacteroidales bacterium]
MSTKVLKHSFLTYLFILSVFTSCNRADDQDGSMMMIELNGKWFFSQAGKDAWLPGKVPGTVHSDLFENEIIEDLFYRLNEFDIQWIENEDWEYKTVFKVSRNLLEMDAAELHFKGLDTYADVYLNGHKILEADNMFIGWEVNCLEYLYEGDNELHIYFHSPVKRGMEKLEKLDFLIPASNEQAPEGKQTNVFTRKAPFHYGWDWGPRLVTSGIWRPVYLKIWNDSKIDDIYLETVSIDNNRAGITSEIEIQSVTGGEYVMSLYINGDASGLSEAIELAAGANKTKFNFSIEDPELWWTNGLGEPHLYNFDFRLEKDGKLIDNYQLDYGIRTVRLVQNPDEVGHSFYFEVNGIPVFMKGSNVIPSETLTTQVTDEDYQNLVRNATEAGMNMLRVWGGAIYEEDYFYQLCDRNGLLVWQDFMFACALQPGDEAHLDNIRKEAEYNIKRLRNHASVALWCGNNENLHGWHHWGWQDLYTPEQRDFMWATYQRIFHEILPAAVREFDPKNTYWSSSPSSGNNQLADRRSGDEHDWTVWFGQSPFSNYGVMVPRFVSEWGLQAFPGMQTIKSFAAEGDMDLNSEIIRKRQRSNMPYIAEGFNGNDMIRWYMEMYYDVPEEFEDFTYVSQLLQAKAYKTAAESHRRSMPHCMGTLYWQLNDCWPTISWSTVDYHNRWKASHYAIKKAFQEVIISPAIEGDNINTYVVSDRLEPAEGEISLALMDFNGKILWSANEKVHILPNTSTRAHSLVESLLPAGDRPGSIFLVTDLVIDGKTVSTNNLYFTGPRYMELPDSEIKFTRSRRREGYSVELESDKLVRNVYLQTSDADATFSDNFFDLVPGRKKTVQIVTRQSISNDKDIRIVSLNDLKHKR